MCVLALFLPGHLEDPDLGRPKALAVAKHPLKLLPGLARTGLCHLGSRLPAEAPGSHVGAVTHVYEALSERPGLC